MKHIKLVIIFMFSTIYASEKYFLQERQEIISTAINKFTGLQNGFEFLQRQNFWDQSFYDLLEQHIPQCEDEEFNLDAIIGQAEEIIDASMKDSFLYCLDIALEENKKLFQLHNPVFMYVMEHKNDYMQSIVRSWLNEWSKIKDSHYWTPLHRAAEINNKEIAELLINAGANLNVEDHDERTPLHVASFKNSKEVAALLISAGAWINTKDCHGSTPLHKTIYFKNKKIIEMLIHAGADLEIQDNNGRIPLHVAISQNKKEIAQLLVAAQTDLAIQHNQSQ